MNNLNVFVFKIYPSGLICCFFFLGGGGGGGHVYGKLIFGMLIEFHIWGV